MAKTLKDLVFIDYIENVDKVAIVIFIPALYLLGILWGDLSDVINKLFNSYKGYQM